MKYYFLYLIYVITKPVRWLLPTYNDFFFATRLLFPNPYARCAVECVARTESGDFTSIKCRTYNNYFGMRPSQKQKYQSGKVPPNLGDFASFSSVFQSVYDFRDWIEHRAGNGTQIYFDALFSGNQLPKGDFKESTSKYNPLNILENYPDKSQVVYLGYVVEALTLAGYHGGNGQQYYNNVLAHWYDFRIRSWSYWTNIVGCIVIYYYIGRYIIRRYKRSKGKKAVQKITYRSNSNLRQRSKFLNLVLPAKETTTTQTY